MKNLQKEHDEELAEIETIKEDYELVSLAYEVARLAIADHQGAITDFEAFMKAYPIEESFEGKEETPEKTKFDEAFKANFEAAKTAKENDC